MAQYTIELGTLVSSGYNVFDDSWDTYIKDHKPVLCDKILRRYWFYEIGQETPDRFKHYLNEQLARIMPYYNQLYRSELLEILPLYNYFMEGNEETARKLARDRSKVNRADSTAIRQMADSLQRLESGDMSGQTDYKRNHGETWTEDKDGTKKDTINETTTGKEITDKDTTEKTVVDTDETLKGSETGKETISDVNDGTKTVDINGTRTTNNTRRYSDTPQAVITEQGMGIDEQYLTNYTRDNGSETTTSKESDVIKNTENKTTDTTKTTDNTKTEDTTTTVTGTEDDTVTTNGTKDVTGSTTTTDDTTGSRNITIGDDTSETQQTRGTEYESKNGTTQDTQSAIQAENEEAKDSEETTGKNALKGFTVSQADLLNAYRKTFINVDNMIIAELEENFMGVF